MIVAFPAGLLAQQWRSIAPMHFARAIAAGVTLLDGRVLVAGGHNGSVALSSCEIYDPNTNTWTMTGSMAEPRWAFPMVRLLDGRVFVAGGITGPVTNGTVATTTGCEIYDPKTGLWQTVAQMSEATENFPLLVLPNGKVFINGGLDANIAKYIAMSEFFDPATNSIQELAPMLIPYFNQIPFYDSIHNQILIQGGSNGGVQGLLLNTTQVYDIASNTWAYGPPALAEHDSYTYTVMPDNSLLCLGGRKASYAAHDTVEVLRPPYTTWQFLGHLTSPRWHGAVARVNNDSVLVIGGNDDPGTNTDVYDSTNWFVYDNDRIMQGPRMLQKRSVFVIAVSKLSGGCMDSAGVFVFGGLAANGQVLNACEVLALSPTENGTSLALTLPSHSPSIIESTCAAVDISIELGIVGCGSPNGRLDSVWLSGHNGSPFLITSPNPTPRSLSALDSIQLSYQSTHGPDTAYLHLRYDLGSGARDTAIMVIGRLASPFLAEPQRLHREAASAYYGAFDSLPLAVDISSSINLDSIWPYLTDISATYAWDSSVVSNAGYLQPNGWTLTSLASHGNSMDIDIQNNASSPSRPLDLGTALFRPKTTQLATSWVTLPRLDMDVGGQMLSLCVTDNEDSHWAVKTLGAMSEVSESPSSLPLSLLVYPNPAGDELFVRNSRASVAAVTIYDAIGRVVAQANVAAGVTSTLDVQGLESGVYFVRIVCSSASRSQVIVKR